MADTSSGAAARRPLVSAPSTARGPFKLSDALALLADEALSKLSDADCQYLAGSAREAVNQASQAAQAASGLATLVLFDQADKPSDVAGSFRSAEDVSGLLFHFSAVFETVSALVELGEAAADELSFRNKYPVLNPEVKASK